MYPVGTNYIGACKSEVQTRTAPVHIAFLRVNSWYTGVPCLYKCASPRAIPWYTFCTMPVHTKFLLVIPKYTFVPCRHKPFFPQMNRRYKISTVLAKPYISGRKAEVQVPVQIQIAAYEAEVQSKKGLK